MPIRLTTRERMERRNEGLRAVRRPFEPDWEEINRLCQPSNSADLNHSNRKNRRRANVNSHDTAGLLAGRKVVNGMSTGLSSSSRPWFKLTLHDRDMLEYQPVKEYLASLESVISWFFQVTDYYEAKKSAYSDIVHMGVSATLCLEHPEYLAVWHPLPVGQYWIALDDGRRVSTLVRRTYPTVDQLVRNVRDWSRLTRFVKNAYDKGDIHLIVPCMHTIEYNKDRVGDTLAVTDKPWRSIKWEEGQDNKNILLSEGGYDSKPFTAPRWHTVGDAVYCDRSPGFDALPDLRELQLSARYRGRAKHMLIKPPMKAPAGLARTGLNLDPGTVTYVDSLSDNNVGPLIQPDYRVIGAIREDIDDLTQRVEELFYADLFMAISDMEGVQPRNEQELLYRNEEKLTQLGPVVDRVNIEMLEVDIDRAFTITGNLGLHPPLPPELQGRALMVDFISILAQAQKASSNTAIERAARFVGFVAGLFPEAAIKFDAEQAIDEFAANSGTSPKIIRSDELVARMKAQMAQQAAIERAAAVAPAMREGAEAAKLLSETSIIPGENTALNNLMQV